MMDVIFYSKPFAVFLMWMNQTLSAGFSRRFPVILPKAALIASFGTCIMRTLQVEQDNPGRDQDNPDSLVPGERFF